MDFQVQPDVYDLLIFGSGAGSKLLAWTFAAKGQRVAVVERKYVGGSCPNIACLPSKNVIHTAQVAHNVRRSGEFGISIDTFHVNMPAVRDRKRRMVQGLIDTHLALYKQSGAELIMASHPRVCSLRVGAGEIMGCVQIAMLGSLPYTTLREAILAHPTIPEGLTSLFSSAAS